MGTSTNHPSPNAPSWNLAKAVLGREGISAEDQSRELWRAATADTSAKLEEHLCGPAILQALDVANRSESVSEALSSYDKAVASSHTATFFADISRRALVRAVASGAGVPGFAQELFAETVSYYASRDLPSIVGAKGKVSNTSAAISLKRQFADIAKDAARGYRTEVSTRSWPTVVASVLAVLKGRRRV
jgi:hypothetical protein